MTITNGYATVDELFDELAGSSVPEETPKAERAIEAASRLIDAYTGRRFWQDTTVQDRVYTSCDPYLLDVPEGISTTTGLVVKLDTNADATYATTITINTDFLLYPSNAIADSEPATTVRLVNGNYSFYRAYDAPPDVQITAKFGYPTVPAAVKEACLFQAAQHLKAAGSPGGIVQMTGFDGVGMKMARLHPQAAALLEGFVRVYV